MAAVLKIGKCNYLSNRLADFDKICMAMNISRFNLISNEKFEKSKIAVSQWLSK